MTLNSSDDERHNEPNPFVAFRHNIDHGLNALWTCWTGQREDCLRELAEMDKRATPTEKKILSMFNGSYERAMNPERVQSESRGREDPIVKSTPQSFRSSTKVSTAPPATRERERDLVDVSTRTSTTPRPWNPPLEYFVFSRYSPLNLEECDPYVNWRGAFEELLQIQAGEDVGTPGATSDRNPDPGEWLQELRRRKLLREQQMLPSTILDIIARPLFGGLFPDQPTAEQEYKREDDTNAGSELDHYETFLGSLGKIAATASEDMRETAVQSRDERHEGLPSIISTMTTTERRVLPDGTVTTKKVLKKRFADGTEETEETTNTTHGTRKPLELEQSRPQSTLNSSKPESAIAEEAKKKSWFWS